MTTLKGIDPKMIANNLKPYQPTHPGEVLKEEMEFCGIIFISSKGWSFINTSICLISSQASSNDTGRFPWESKATLYINGMPLKNRSLEWV